MISEKNSTVTVNNVDFEHSKIERIKKVTVSITGRLKPYCKQYQIPFEIKSKYDKTKFVGNETSTEALNQIQIGIMILFNFYFF